MAGVRKPRKLLIDRDMKRKGLCERAGRSAASPAKTGRSGYAAAGISEAVF